MSGDNEHDQTGTVVKLDERRKNLIDDVGTNEPPTSKVVATVGGPVENVSFSLCLYGERLKPAHVTQLLDRKPTRSAKRGDRRGNRSPPYERGFWIWTSRSDEFTDLPTVVRRLADAFPQSEETWIHLRTQYEIQIRCGVHFSGWNRGFSLSAEALEWFQRTGAELLFDLYAYGDEEDEI